MPRAARDGPAAARPAAPDPPPPSGGGLVLPAWALATGAGVPVSDPDTYLSQYAPSSDPLVLQDGRHSGRRLPLFGAAHVRGSVGGSAGGASTSSAPPPQPAALAVEAGVAADVVFYAGGPVWALDWCPQVVREGDRVSRFLAVGVPIAGPALIQLWRLPVGGSGAVKPGVPSRSSGGPPPPPILLGPAALPRPALALAHGGGLAWDCKWRPTGSRGVVSGGGGGGGGGGAAAAARPPLLGVLAAALGDGTVVVWAVPVPSSVKAAGGAGAAGAPPPSTGGRKRKAPVGAAGEPSTAAAAAARPPPPILDLAPAAAGACGLPSSLEWCPSPPVNLLAASCWDGSAVLWRVGEWEGEEEGGGPPARAPPRPWGGEGETPPQSSYGLSPLLRVQGEASPLRAVAWPPPPLRTSYSGSPPLTLFATAGHAADLGLWDAATPAAPRLGIALPREWALALAWLPHPLGLLVAQDGGRLTFVPLDAGTASTTHALSLDGHGEAWSVHATAPSSPSSSSSSFGCAVAAYGVGSGDVGVFEVKTSAKGRTLTGHRVVAGFRRRAAGGGVGGAAPLGGRGAAGGGRGRGRGRGRGAAAAAASTAAPPPPTGLALPTTDRTLVLPPAAALAKDACVYRGATSDPAAAKAAAARSSLPDEGVAVTRVRWADSGGCSDWTWLASAGGLGVVRLQLVDVWGCGK